MAVSGNLTILDTAYTFGTFRNKTTFNAQQNKGDAVLTKYQLNIDPPGAAVEGTIEVKIYKNATLTGTPVWNDIDTATSSIEVDSIQTYVSGGSIILWEYVNFDAKGGNASSPVNNITSLGLHLHPGDTATIVATKVFGADDPLLRCVFGWKETR